MAAPTMYSDEELYQQTGSWEAAAARRDEQNNALNQYNWSQQAASTPANTGIASLVNNTQAASLPSYEAAYNAFGGKDATNALLTTLRDMGLSRRCN